MILVDITGAKPELNQVSLKNVQTCYQINISAINFVGTWGN